eukprot:689030-Amphidinium_carterae.1
MAVDARRCRALNKISLPAPVSKGGAATERGGTVIYWMSRDQRAHDNWALIRAQEIALEVGASLRVVFCLVPKFLDATFRHYDFLLRGLHETATELARVNIAFELRFGEAQTELPKVVKAAKPVRAVVCDMSPLRVPKRWTSSVAKVLTSMAVPLLQVDAHNVVPVWEASEKQEVGARTIRKKIMGRFREFLKEFPKLKKHPAVGKRSVGGTKALFNLQKALSYVKVDRSVGPVDGMKPGSAAAHQKLQEFLAQRLKIFAQLRNDPTKEALFAKTPAWDRK